MSKKATRRAMLTSVIALMLCFAMLIGTTYAWFTDSVTSANNVIKSGTLDIEFKWKNGTADPAVTADWTDASTGAIFTDNELWEPGYVSARHISIANVGTLALQYWVRIAVNGTLETNSAGHTLADAIDVYYIDDATQLTDRNAFEAAIANVTPIPLSVALENMSGTGDTAHGVLYPANTTGRDSSHVKTIALKMRESAGNEYQGMQLGASFSVQLFATQWTYEADSFDDQYDKFSYVFNDFADASVTLTSSNLNGALYIQSATDTRSSAVIPSVNPDGTANTSVLKYTTDGTTFEDFDVAPGHDDVLVLNVDLTDQQENSATYDISLINQTHDTVLKGLNKVVAVTIIIPSGLDNVTVRHSGVSMSKATDTTSAVDQTYYYDSANGVLTIWTSSFSPFMISWGTQSVFSEYLNINPIVGVDIIPNSYNFGIIKEQIDGLASNLNNNGVDINNMISGAIYVPKEGNNDSQLLLQNGRQYAAADHEAYSKLENGKYQYWHGDFVMKFNKKIDAFTDQNMENTIILAGAYGDWGWLKIPCTAEIPANQEYRMIKDFMGGAITINFEELCTTVSQFNCGAVYVKDSNYDTSDPLTMTIEFRMYEVLSAEEANAQGYGNTVNQETGNYIVVDQFTYTFK